ncbi:ATP-binding cassette domain-containing protein [Tessaracoccus sp. OH4464_COT-324]|uniref:ATP-binding cassette domain-containing protein n=1 Tax=Tessaracoccus sp. OH4464_COT-324 TaxID=2491059 RepID=UPI000F62EE27|nr:ATP-binding cassette domain-containing protein [Tessaracoccus sp. OH4464_COT-324]RRD46396.1 ATP-binding cassette domain-containing protein [Tessaracoccus sp. OH4464_COT-324]
MTALLTVHRLEAEASLGRVFGPLDLELNPGLCLVEGEEGTGKSSLLLALTGRMRGVSGSLLIGGVDAIDSPRRAMQITSVARLGNYVVPEDRLTLRESIYERCFLEGIRPKRGLARFTELENVLGIRFDRAIEMETFTPLERAVAAVCLALIREACVVALDDADALVPTAQQPVLYQLLDHIARTQDAVVVATVNDADAAPAGTTIVRLPNLRSASTVLIDRARTVVEVSDQPISVDPEVIRDALRNSNAAADAEEGSRS